jgi:hypothetical protein
VGCERVAEIGRLADSAEEGAGAGGHAQVVGPRRRLPRRRRREHARARRQGRYGVQRLEHGLEPLALLHDPVVVEAGEQLAAVALARRGAQALVGQLLELDGVAGDRRWVPLHGETVGREHAATDPTRRLQHAAQHGQRRAEAVAADVGRDVGPDELDELLARVALVRTQGQAGEQRRDGATRQSRQHHVATAQLETAQQADLPSRRQQRRGVRRRSDVCPGVQSSPSTKSVSFGFNTSPGRAIGSCPRDARTMVESNRCLGVP